MDDARFLSLLPDEAQGLDLDAEGRGAIEAVLGDEGSRSHLGIFVYS